MQTAPMDRLVRTAAFLGSANIKFQWDDDFCCRLNHLHTTTLLVIFSIVVSTRQYVGDAILCWTPGEWTSTYDKYANNICWVSNTYFIPFDDDIPQNLPDRRRQEITYYQWVGFILLLQALGFYIPCLMWRATSASGGVDIGHVVEAAIDSHNINPEHKQKTVRNLARHLEHCLEGQREYRSGFWIKFKHRLSRVFCICCSIRYGNFISAMFLLVKLFYLANCILQLIALNYFLKANTPLYGLKVFYDLLNGSDWESSGRFPRVSICDFRVRRMGNTNLYTVQCVLPVNMFNEKVFIFVWLWILLMSIVNIASLLSWINFLFFPAARQQYLLKHLKISGQYRTDGDNDDRKLLKIFTRNYLRTDGTFLLRIIAKNSSEVLVTTLVKQMWENFKKPRTGLIKPICNNASILGSPLHGQIDTANASKQNDHLHSTNTDGRRTKVLLRDPPRNAFEQPI